MSTLADDEINTRQDPTLVMGVMGVGTFVIGFLLVAVGVIWFLSYSCAPVVKSVWRGVSFTIFLIAALILVYAPRTNQYENTSLESAVSTLTIPMSCRLPQPLVISLHLPTNITDLRLLNHSEDSSLCCHNVILRNSWSDVGGCFVRTERGKICHFIRLTAHVLLSMQFLVNYTFNFTFFFWCCYTDVHCGPRIHGAMAGRVVISNKLFS